MPIEPERGTVRFAAASDLHIATSGDLVAGSAGLTAKDVAALVNKAKAGYDSRRTLDVLVEMRRRAHHCVLIPGDLSVGGQSSEFDDVERLIRATLRGQNLVAVPGNHDFWSSRQLGDREYLLGAALSKRKYPSAENIHGVKVIGLCSPHEQVRLIGNARGQIDDLQLDELDKILGEVDSERGLAIVLLHHPFRHDKGAGTLGLGDHSLANAAALGKVLDFHESVVLAVAGHLHEPWLCHCSRVPLISCPSAGEQRAFLEFTLDLATRNLRDVSIRIRQSNGAFEQRALLSCDLNAKRIS